ncbi:MAG: hypothetical protein WBL19_01180 [Minisyncoccia bacterium]
MIIVLQALKKVFRKPRYVLLALITGAIVFAFAVWLPNLPLIVQIMGHSEISFSQKLDLPWSLLGSIATNFTLLSASYTIAIAVLFGVYVAMATYFLKRRIKEVGQGDVATGFFGITSGVIGMGCAACGSFLLMSILSFVGAGGVLVLLPLQGSEFGILGAILLALAVYVTAKQIENPLVCKVPITKS